MKKYTTVLLLTTIAFMVGFLLRGILSRPDIRALKDRKIANGESTRYQEQPYDDSKQLSKEAQKKYHELIVEYMDYIKEHDQDPPVSLDDFIVIRRDLLIQEDKYTDQDESMDNQIMEWYTDLERPGASGVLRSYLISGDIKGLDTKDLNNSDLMIGTLSNPTKDQSPTIPDGHIAFERFSQYTYLSDNAPYFDLNIKVLENDAGESEPIYILALLIPNNPPYNIKPIMSGTDNRVSGVPAHMLSRRKDNRPVEIKLKRTSSSIDVSDLDINNIYDGSILTLYGIDQINKIDPSLNLLRTVISSKDGSARMRSLPSGSQMIINSPNENTGFWIETTLTGKKNNIRLGKKPYCKKDQSCLNIIRPLGVRSPEITIYSKNPKIKMSKSFKNDNSWHLTAPELKDAYLELKDNNQSLGIMRINTINNKTGIIEPVYKNIVKLAGSINRMGSSKIDKDWSDCKISIKLSEKEGTCSKSGVFELDDVSIIDGHIDLLIEDKDVDATINVPVTYGHNKLNIKANVPSSHILRSWNMLAPTTPSNNFIYGEIPYHKSYRAFLIGFDLDISKEAVYFNKLGIPDRSIYSTHYDPVDGGFGKFLFNDIPKGKYVLHLISGEDIIHSRIIYIDSKSTFVLK